MVDLSDFGAIAGKAVTNTATVAKPQVSTKVKPKLTIDTKISKAILPASVSLCKV
ncbi:hypothetical protein [Nostoc sp. C057]|uniref:hypothetical protein n=1 Tax=Nostoc sp. C057 TaxID=2576903 RepID=UPI0015C3113E|nr:hypothetical protein [Nostoc sp. C057]